MSAEGSTEAIVAAAIDRAEAAIRRAWPAATTVHVDPDVRPPSPAPSP